MKKGERKKNELFVQIRFKITTNNSRFSFYDHHLTLAEHHPEKKICPSNCKSLIRLVVVVRPPVLHCPPEGTRHPVPHPKGHQSWLSRGKPFSEPKPRSLGQRGSGPAPWHSVLFFTLTMRG